MFDRHAQVERRLLWIFGSPRSGSTWLLRMLDDCPGITGVDEPLIGLQLAPFLCDRPGSRAEDLDVTNCTFNRVAAGSRGYFFSNRFRDAWRRPLRDLICSRFGAQVKDDVIAIKEPNGSQAADLILDALPRSRVLFLLRDGRDVVDSFIDSLSSGSWMSERYPIRGIESGERWECLADAAYKWVWQTQIVHEALEHHAGPKLLLRYEDMRRDPLDGLARLLEWAGVSADVDAIVERHVFERLSDRGTGRFNRSARPGGWRANLSEPEKQLIEGIMGPTLSRFGYELETSRGEAREPSPPRTALRGPSRA